MSCAQTSSPAYIASLRTVPEPAKGSRTERTPRCSRRTSWSSSRCTRGTIMAGYWKNPCASSRSAFIENVQKSGSSSERAAIRRRSIASNARKGAGCVCSMDANAAGDSGAGPARSSRSTATGGYSWMRSIRAKAEVMRDHPSSARGPCPPSSRLAPERSHAQSLRWSARSYSAHPRKEPEHGHWGARDYGDDLSAPRP